MEQRVGDYVLERELARGGMGAVFLAHHREVRRPVAIKLLHSSAEQHLKRFQVEALALARLRHPHIVSVHDVSLAGDQPYLAMQYVEGEALDRRIEREGPLPPEEVARLGQLLAGALAYAHGEGILHRDLKPANVLLADDGPLLADFGLARELSDERERLTLSGQLVGTPAYMPPEQATGDRAAIGPATDVYGLGATLYHALSGQPPFSGQSLMSLVAAVTSRPPTPLRTLRPEVPAPLATIVERCLAKPPGDRYPDAQALADDLGRFLAGERVVGGRRGRALGVALVLVAGLALLGVWTLGSTPSPQAAPTAASSPSARPTPTPAQAPAGPAELAALEGRPFLIKARRWLRANPRHPQAAGVRRRFVQVGLAHPLHLTGPRGVDPIAAWFVSVDFGRRKRARILSVEQDAMSFDLWDPRSRERLKRYGRSDYRGQLTYDRARNSAKALDPAGQVHDWMLDLLDLEHNRWFVRDPEKRGRAWSERPSHWAPTPKHGHMTLVFRRPDSVEVYQEHQHRLLARLAQPGPVASLAWTPDERRLVTVGADRTNKVSGYIVSWAVGSSVRAVKLNVVGRPLQVVAHPNGRHVAVAVSYRIELRDAESLALVHSFAAPDAGVPGLKSRQAHTTRVRTLAFSRTGDRLYSFALRSSDDVQKRKLGELRAWDGERPYRHLAVERSSRMHLFSLDVSPSGDQLLAVSRDHGQRRQLTLYDVAVAAPK